jgi:hypothetical protein
MPGSEISSDSPSSLPSVRLDESLQRVKNGDKYVTNLTFYNQYLDFKFLRLRVAILKKCYFEQNERM